jgi:hypothetical protein
VIQTLAKDRNLFGEADRMSAGFDNALESSSSLTPVRCWGRNFKSCFLTIAVPVIFDEVCRNTGSGQPT